MPPSAQESRRHASRYLSRSQRKLLLLFLKCVIMAVVIFLLYLLFIFGFAAIVFLHFLFMSNTFNRRCASLFQQHARRALDGSPSAASTDPHPPPPPLLPDVPYSASAFSWTSDCAICLDSFQEGDECRNIPVCSHLFHAKCLDRWIRKKPTCPVCRTRVDLGPFLNAGACRDDQWKTFWGAVNFEEGTSH